MVRRVGRWAVILLALIGCGAVLAALLLLRDGISARPEPGDVEAAVAIRLRALAIPGSAKNRANPLPATPEAIEDGMAHWADHCAVCHGNNGDGQTEMGRGLYPRPPDMRLPRTQDLSDGTLFYIIEEGVKFTGMPAWGTGTADGEAASWRLVHFIRRLPSLTDEELERMKGMNPRSADEWREEEEMRRFLEGEGEAPKPRAKPAHKHGGHE